MLDALRRDVELLANPEKARVLRRFFKTAPGQYGEGDVFLGIVVPDSRKIAKKYADLAFEEVSALLKSKTHEERLIALFILIAQFEKGNTQIKEEIFRLYLKHTAFINNWDLVDLSAEKIVGAYLERRPKEILYELARSESLWERRISIIATFRFIKEGKYEDTFTIASILLRDREDLIHKATGWMLREVGKRCSEEVEETFLRKHLKEMPRTMLRYAIERFSPEKRRQYLQKT
ncbi:MAG: DNA alkylation repair protein [Proteobacteria bacterium]|nr:DNA alkylation repair protein [Pseudomonadota bacterium]